MSSQVHFVRLVGALLFLLVAGVPLVSPAQDSPESDGGESVEAPAEKRLAAELTEEQLVLNDEGVRSLIEGDYAGAVAMLSRSIKLGPSNVAYLNLGRAYQKMQRCEESREALEKVHTAPVVENPPPSEVSKRADEFMAELEQQCEFDEPASESDEGDDEPTKTSGEPPESEELPNPRLRPEPKPPVHASAASKTWGIVSVASGAALIGGGVGMHLWARDIRSPVLGTDEDETVIEISQPRAAELEDEANLRDTIGLGMVIGGGVVAGVGTFLLIRGGTAERASSIVVQPNRRGFAVGWRTEF